MAAEQCPVPSEVDQPIRHVLVAEDEPLVRDLLTEYLQMGFPGVRVSTATTLTEVRDCLQAMPVDVVILDLHLADTEGIATLTAVSEHNPALPIVVVTGDPDPTLAEHAITHGAADYIPKTSLKLDSFTARVQSARDKQQWSRRTLETLRQVSEALHHGIHSPPRD
jgi:DNA-binding NarL/FixJ family response regulator